MYGRPFFSVPFLYTTILSGYFSDKYFFLFAELSQWFQHHSSHIHSKILVYKYLIISSGSYYERRESQWLPKFDLELYAILISVFINRATWNWIAHAAFVCSEHGVVLISSQALWAKKLCGTVISNSKASNIFFTQKGRSL